MKGLICDLAITVRIDWNFNHGNTYGQNRDISYLGISTKNGQIIWPKSGHGNLLHEKYWTFPSIATFFSKTSIFSSQTPEKHIGIFHVVSQREEKYNLENITLERGICVVQWYFLKRQIRKAIDSNNQSPRTSGIVLLHVAFAVFVWQQWPLTSPLPDVICEPPSHFALCLFFPMQSHLCKFSPEDITQKTLINGMIMIG